MKTRVIVLRVILAALLLLLAASIFIGFRVLRGLPNTIVYYIKSEDTHFVLEGVYRRYAATPETQLKAALEDLIDGPKPQETSRGLYSSVPPDTRILELQVEGASVQVNFSKAFIQESGLADLQGRLNQVFYTLSQPEAINQVEILVENQPLTLLGGEGLIVDNPWERLSRETLPNW